MSDGKVILRCPISSDGLFLPGDPEDKCCYVIPLKFGVQLLAVYTLFSSIAIILPIMHSIKIPEF